jgi:diaminopimelate epimerase
MKFTKAHGLGNDFILVAQSDAPADLTVWTRTLCDRHRGIGGDGVVLHTPAPDGIRMALVNADGLGGEISGNGLRCLAALAVRHGWAPAHHTVHTVVGPRPVEVEPLGGGRYRIATGLGVPGLGSKQVPLSLDPPQERVTDLPLEVAGRTVHVTATSMGNPHCAVFLDEPASDAVVRSLGPALESHPLFPERTNVEFVTVVSLEEIRVRFWERGVGYTQASGTGSASAVVASILTGRTGRAVRAVCDGGVLDVSWPDDEAPLHQTGEAQLLYDGDWLGD